MTPGGREVLERLKAEHAGPLRVGSMYGFRDDSASGEAWPCMWSKAMAALEEALARLLEWQEHEGIEAALSKLAGG